MHLRESFIFLVVFLSGIIAGNFIRTIASVYRQGISFRKLFEAGEIFSFLSKIKKTGFRLRCFPLVELASAVVFTTCYCFFGFTPNFFKYVVVLGLLLVISVIDFRAGIIPNRFLLGLFAWLFLWQLIDPYLPLESVMVGFLAGGALFYVIALLSRGGMGGGDIKLMAVLGFAVGWPYVLVVFLISFILGAVAGALLLLSGRKTLKDSLAFAPFLSLGFFLVNFWGVEIWEWYAFFW
ncbi:MAG: prepilin peptidase [Firmicutes bacterium]|nr:prepilin peptidase [Bacillota bacterium]